MDGIYLAKYVPSISIRFYPVTTFRDSNDPMYDLSLSEEIVT
jgi:hypothetical protein